MEMKNMGIAQNTRRMINFLTMLLAFFIVLASLLAYFLDNLWFLTLLAIAIITYGFLIWTFRDPKREIETNPAHVLAPADGRVTEVIENKDRIYVLIRMSPFDVHMTRSPIDGEITEIRFKKGSHWPAYFPKYAKRNQRNRIEIVTTDKRTKVVVTQVSGIFARRTIAYCNKGEKVKQGEVIGTIRFGSLTSLEIISSENYKLVQPFPEIVRAGKTILAKKDENCD
ncbi:MAG: phosphatidylserine decarboxylase [Candidatus Heimdallarchaeaceae archaeon]